MSRPTIKNALLGALKMLLLAILKLLAIAFAWVCKIVGMTLLKIGEGIEKIITR
ncbi:MAG: hypothetical protein IPG01_13370 [Chitinophagaceae bacterium]|nr:hypothetical protein [Chitinophagaceae bacterium]